ncbi:hypothetical protein [Cellulomonas sp. URHE0023]|uniref:hypothetical protein n=1 Tax=Cellulomonas sp. URHE0023 TaxID=1380354 RepID=UPI000691AF6F|nr:hypothetical protein [Cellulomonas sp. URHE0023]
MSRDQHEDVAPHGIGPGRFQQVDHEPEQRSVARSIGAAVLLLLLVVGVPVALLALGAAPAVPTSLPTREEITGSIGAEQLLAVLVWVVWLAWLQFTVCVVVELRSALSGVGIPRHVPLAGPSQRVARTLVVAVLLLTTAAGQASAAVSSVLPQHAPATVSVSASVDVEGVQAAPDMVTETPAAAQGETTYWLGDTQLDADEGAELVGKLVYVVQPPEGRHHDNLWDIAERTLGEGRRYDEVFALNKDRPQPDGHALTLERLIYPNWLLVMPEGAAGVERVTAVVTPVEVPVAPAPVESTVAPAAATGDTVVTATDTVVAPVADSGIGTTGLVGAGLLAAGLLVAIDRLRRRSRTLEPSPDAIELEVALRVGADPVRALLLDQGLRQLADGLDAMSQPLPGVVSATVDDDALELRVTPPAHIAPSFWSVQEGGSVWRFEARHIDPARKGGVAPYPGLVSLGRDAAGRDVLVDLEAAQGPVAIVGDLAVGAEIASAIAAELSTNRWSDALRVTGVDLPAGLDVLPGERYTSAASASLVLERLRGRRADVLGADVLSGRVQARGAGTWVPEYVVLGAVPADATAREVVDAAATTQRSPLGVVCVGDLPGARWQLVAQADGRVTARLLGIDVQANRLSAAQVAGLAELLAVPSEPVTSVDERRAAVENEGSVERPAVPAPERRVTEADLQSAAVRVQVLGEPLVECSGLIDESRRALATELVVFMALHPGGVHANVLGAALWPGGVTAEVREATIERTAAWLGDDASGRPHLARRADGRLTLGPGVVVDWDVVCSLLASSRAAAGPQAERADLEAALTLARGAVLSVRPTGRYAWLARIRLERASRALLVDAVHRLVVLCRDGDDPAAAQTAAWSGLRFAPVEELLWRDVLRAAAALDGPDAVREIADDLAATLRAAGGSSPSAATLALVEELAPSSSAAAQGSA